MMIHKLDLKQPLEAIETIKTSFERIRMQQIEELKALDSSLKLFEKLLNIFESESQQRISEIRIARDKLDVMRLLEITHRFKSTAYNLGASRAIEIIKVIEDVACHQPKFHKDLGIIIQALENECQSAHAELANFLKTEN